MGAFDGVRAALLPHTASLFDYGMDDSEFFLALLRACPEGSRIAFDSSEPDSFVAAFQNWSFRSDPDRFEADYYTIDSGLAAAAERMARGGALDLHSCFDITSPGGELLCACRDGFMVIKLASELAAKLKSLRGRQMSMPEI